MTKLTALEYRVLAALLESSAGNGHDFGYIEDALLDSFNVGITGCEGLNRFYDFAVRR